MINFSSEISKNGTLIQLSKEPTGELQSSLNIFIENRRGECLSEKTYFIPRKVNTKHLQMLFDEANIELLSTFAKPKKKYTSSDIDDYNSKKIEDSSGEKVPIEDIYINFGKFKGMKYIHINKKYLKWIIENNLSKEVVEHAKEALKKKTTVYIKI